MKEATKRAASEALAQMLAVTAMLVIASLSFMCGEAVITGEDRHCEERSDEAIQLFVSCTSKLDCFAALAMTLRDHCIFSKYGTIRPANGRTAP